MRDLAVDQARSHLSVAARPALPGIRLHLRVEGGTIAIADGTLHGSLRASAWCTGTDGPGPLTTPPWLAGGGEVPLALTIIEGRVDNDRCTITIAATGPGPDLTVRGSGRCTPAGEGVDVAGTTLCDPRMLGFALPPLVTFALTIRWRLHLVPVPASPGPPHESTHG